jgi:TonB-dependent receptor
VSSAAGAGNDYYDGRYVNGPYLYAGALAGLYTTPLSPSFGRDFNDTENVYAAYGMYTGTFDRLTVLAGLRIEATDASYGNILEATDASGNVTDTPVTHKKSYANLFPTVQLRYEIRPNLLARATWSTGIARPGFSQAGGFAGVDFTTSPRPQYTAGNPDLKPTTGNNFDLSLEYYTGQGGVAQIGFFDKEFSNYIFKHTKIMVSDPIFQGQLGDVSSFSNEDAWARGFEFALHQQFVFLPGLWRGLGVEANGTWVDSRFLEYDASVAGAGVNEYGQLPGTSHVTWNLALFYELGGLNLRLSSAYVGKSLFGLNGDKSLDTIQATKVNYDFTSSYAFTRNLTAYFNVKNLSNTPLRYNEGSNARVIQREIYGQTYEAGLRFRY